MSTHYARTVEFSTTGSETKCIQVPTGSAGRINKFVLMQSGGVVGSAEFSLFSRKCACRGQVDIRVAKSGSVSAIETSSGSCLITTADPHGLQVGEKITVRWCDIPAYDTDHVVVSVPSSTTVVTDVSYTEDAAEGVWQSAPFNPSGPKDLHLLLDGQVSSGTPFNLLQADIDFSNTDNKYETNRTPSWSCWLDFEQKTNDNEVRHWALTITVAQS